MAVDHVSYVGKLKWLRLGNLQETNFPIKASS